MLSNLSLIQNAACNLIHEFAFRRFGFTYSVLGFLLITLTAGSSVVGTRSANLLQVRNSFFALLLVFIPCTSCYLNVLVRQHDAKLICLYSVIPL
jgi:hypothetical protein